MKIMEQNTSKKHDLQNLTVGELAAEDYRKAEVFKKFGIDFCCGGNKLLEKACHDKNIESQDVITALNQLNDVQNKSDMNFNRWELDKLADYIVDKHHSYISKAVPVLNFYLNKVSSVHGDDHPNTLEIFSHFIQLSGELNLHMLKEEDVLFPFINKLVEAAKTQQVIHAPFGSVEGPIRMMIIEHEAAGNELESIRTLSDFYSPPEDACTTFKVTYAKLKEFEEDLKFHIHLENNILFPKALALAKIYLQ